MTSKEALEEIKDYALVTYDEEGNEEDCVKFGELEPNLIEPIKKDLEILEILKRNLYVEKGSGKFKGIEIIVCSLGNQHSEDFNEVKEWLENEKNYN